MQKKDYPIEEQLIDIAANTPLTLKKDPWSMTEDELYEAEKEAAKYVHWIESRDCIQLVPALIGANRALVSFQAGDQVLFTCSDSDSDIDREAAVILRKLTPEEADTFDVGPMYELRLNNGNIETAFYDELEQVGPALEVVHE